MLTRDGWPKVNQLITIWFRSGRAEKGVLTQITATKWVLRIAGPAEMTIRPDAVEAWWCYTVNEAPPLMGWMLECSECGLSEPIATIPGVGIDLQQQAILEEATQNHREYCPSAALTLHLCDETPLPETG